MLSQRNHVHMHIINNYDHVKTLCGLFRILQTPPKELYRIF